MRVLGLPDVPGLEPQREDNRGRLGRSQVPHQLRDWAAHQPAPGSADPLRDLRGEQGLRAAAEVPGDHLPLRGKQPQQPPTAPRNHLKYIHRPAASRRHNYVLKRGLHRPREGIPDDSGQEPQQPEAAFADEQEPSYLQSNHAIPAEGPTADWNCGFEPELREEGLQPLGARGKAAPSHDPTDPDAISLNWIAAA